MRVLCHIHTLNDADVIDAAIAAVLGQQHPVDGILIVDNASTDDTLARSFPSHTTLIRHPINTGTSGSVQTGFRFATESGYDWIWVLDADSRPEPDALAKLFELFASLPPEQQKEIGSISSRIVRGANGVADEYGLITPRGPAPAKIDPDGTYYECDSGIWSGTLFRMEAVRAIDPPYFGPRGCWDDFALDWGDIEYHWRMRRTGFRLLVHQRSFIGHALGWQRTMQVMGRTVISTNHAAFRRYLYWRNGLHFWLRRNPTTERPAIFVYLLRHMVSQIAKIVVLEDERWIKVRAILAGAADGFRGRIETEPPAWTRPRPGA